jgi:hypothetical protein
MWCQLHFVLCEACVNGDWGLVLEEGLESQSKVMVGG